MPYRVHHLNMRMTRDEDRLARFLNSLDGEVVAIIPNVTPVPATYVDFVLVVEKVAEEASGRQAPDRATAQLA
ncbi:MAG: hypothetical protein GX657_12285 [Chloroflexi bacterium]|jgi:hypothetical protein|nr:hypothetical protein [Chloroflexota bacterium]